MPVRECSADGRPGFAWGEGGKCYTYAPGDAAGRKRARQQAVDQGYAAGARGDELVSEKAMGEGADGGPLVPPMYSNVPRGARHLCPRCGKPISADATKCPNCGYVLQKADSQQSADPPDVKGWHADFDIKSVTEDEKGTLLIEGYGNTWAEDRDGETVARDAFDDGLDLFMTNPVLLLNHDKHRVIGQVKAATPDAIGLKILAEVPQPGADAEGWHKQAYEWIKKGILKSFSMGGLFYRSKSAAGLIYKVDLYEMSVVTIPSNPTSLFRVAAMKGFDGFEGKTKPTGVGRGHGAHHHGPLRAGARRRHRHANGVRHRHRMAGGHAHRRRTRRDVELELKEADFDVVVDDENDGDDLLDDDAELDMEEMSVDDLEGKATWTSAYINDLPDSSFAYIEPGGTKDSEGKTTPRSKRHFPYKDANGKVDLPHLRNALARAPQSQFGDAAMSKLRAAARSAGVGEREIDDIIGTKEVVAVGEPGTKDKKDGDGGDDSNVVTIDKKSWDETQTALGALLTEKKERDLEKQAEEEAKKRIAAQKAKEAEDEKAAKEEAARVEAMVKAKVAELAGAVSSGRKFTWGDGADPNDAAGGKQTRIVEFCQKLVQARRGDYDAFKWLKEQDAKAAAAYGTKAYGEGGNAAGGFLVPPAYLQQGIAEFRIAQAKVRALVTVVNGINTNSVLIPRETGISSVGWTAESAAKPSTDATFGQITVGIYTLAGIAKVSNQLLEDSSPAVDQIIRRDLGKAIGQAEDIAMINGTGVGQPTGILGTSGVLTGAVGTKLWSSIAGAIATIQSNYFGNPTAILAHPRTVNTLRTTTDSSGRPIFLPNYWQGGGPQAGGPLSYLNPGAVGMQNENFRAPTPDGYVFGLPVFSDANIPTNLGGGANEDRLIVGAWDEAWLLEREGMGLDVSNEAGTSFEQNQTWFRVEERLGFTAARQPSAFYVMTGLTAGAGL